MSEPKKINYVGIMHNLRDQCPDVLQFAAFQTLSVIGTMYTSLPGVTLPWEAQRDFLCLTLGVPDPFASDVRKYWDNPTILREQMYESLKDGDLTSLENSNGALGTYALTLGYLCNNVEVRDHFDADIEVDVKLTVPSFPDLEKHMPMAVLLESIEMYAHL